MTPSAFLPLVGAGLVAGAMNALAGGGAFVTMPALVGVGLPSVTANATSATALYPAGVGSSLVYARSVGRIGAVRPPTLALMSLIGGAAGAALLVLTPTSVFDVVLPWLLLIATIGYALAPSLEKVVTGGRPISAVRTLAFQFVLCVYGGYFGGAVGIMMVAFWTLIGVDDPSLLHANRTMAVSAANTAAVSLFVALSMVAWREVAIMLPSALLGGWAGARIGRDLRPRTTRIVTIAIATAVTIMFFVRAYD